MDRLSLNGLKRKSVQWSPTIPGEWRLASRNDQGRAIGILPRKSFDPSRVRTGDRIGCFTVTRLIAFASCGTMILAAHMECDCGWIIPVVELTGDVTQRLSCGHHNGMSPDHWYASQWWKNYGAYRTVAKNVA